MDRAWLLPPPARPTCDARWITYLGREPSLPQNPHCSRRQPPIYIRTKRLMLQRLDLPLLFLRLKCPGHPKEEISRRNKESSKR
ncbi:hypothetical protein ZEAMMB73_Zm00001d023351 [Zea mays]|uniref:Uncharacterized protein n=1 Tax=Zea mays TaxID=4577 RepID=A0A1D6ISZ1_MAIZE|nr:hypothetical protein ZEAMMB73_Zm00001d023351 [Zea mays]